MSLLTKNARRGWILLILVIYLFPFGSLAINEWREWIMGMLCILELELKDFLTAWIALGGVIGVAVNIFMSQTRITQQKEQFEEQQKFQQKQFGAQQELQFKEQRDARFVSGVELLGNPHESTRIGGAYNLYFLAREFPDDYLNPVCEILCAHLRSIAHKDKFKTEEQREGYPTNEVQAIVDFLFRKHEDNVSIFADKRKPLTDLLLCKVNFGWEQYINTAVLKKVDFEGSELNNLSFQGVKFIWTLFDRTILNNVRFYNAILTAVRFHKAELTNTPFCGATITNCYFGGAQLDGVDFGEEVVDETPLRTKFISVDFDGAQLTDVRFQQAQLSNVDFKNSGLDKVDFGNATIEGFANFEGTKLESYTVEEIVNPGRSKELTSNKESKNEEGQEENAEASISG